MQNARGLNHIRFQHASMQHFCHVAGKKGAGAGPPTAGKEAAERAERKRSETPPTPSPRKGASAGATFEMGEYLERFLQCQCRR